MKKKKGWTSTLKLQSVHIHCYSIHCFQKKRKKKSPPPPPPKKKKKKKKKKTWARDFSSREGTKTPLTCTFFVLQGSWYPRQIPGWCGAQSQPAPTCSCLSGHHLLQILTPFLWQHQHSVPCTTFDLWPKCTDDVKMSYLC